VNLASQFPKPCACGAAIGSHESWRALELVGDQRLPWGEVLELRNHACGSTLAIQTEKGEEE
jgi:hypothetical protein